MSSIIRMKLASSVTRPSGITRREWWCVMPGGRIASYWGCPEVFVEGASTPNFPRRPSESATLFDPDVRLPHDLLPAREVGADLLGELGRRVARGLDAERGVAPAHVRLGEHRRDFLLQAADDFARRLRRREDAGPGIDHEALEPALDEGRHFGQRAGALRRRDAEPPQLAALPELLRRRDGGEHEGNLPAHHVAHGLAAAFVRYMGERQAGALREQLAREVRRAPGAGRAIRELLFKAQELSEVFGRNRRMRDQDQGGVAELRDRSEVAHPSV